MSKLIKKILRPIIVEIINEVLYDKVHSNTLYRKDSKGISILKNWVFEEILNNPPKKD